MPTLEQKRNILRLALSEGGTLQDGILLCIGQGWTEGLFIMMAYRGLQRLEFEDFYTAIPLLLPDKKVMEAIFNSKLDYAIEAADFLELGLDTINWLHQDKARIAPITEYNTAASKIIKCPLLHVSAVKCEKMLVDAIAAKDWYFIWQFFKVECREAEYLDFVKKEFFTPLRSGERIFGDSLILVEMIQKCGMDMTGLNGYYLEWKDEKSGETVHIASIEKEDTFVKGGRLRCGYDNPDIFYQGCPFTLKELKKGIIKGDIKVLNFHKIRQYYLKKTPTP